MPVESYSARPVRSHEAMNVRVHIALIADIRWGP